MLKNLVSPTPKGVQNPALVPSHNSEPEIPQGSRVSSFYGSIPLSIQKGEVHAEMLDPTATRVGPEKSIRGTPVKFLPSSRGSGEGRFGSEI